MLLPSGLALAVGQQVFSRSIELLAVSHPIHAEHVSIRRVFGQPVLSHCYVDRSGAGRLGCPRSLFITTVGELLPSGLATAACQFLAIRHMRSMTVVGWSGHVQYG